MWGTRSEHVEGSQSDTSFYQSVFAEHVTKIRDNEETIEEDVRVTNVTKFRQTRTCEY